MERERRMRSVMVVADATRSSILSELQAASANIQW